jgi:hypothetical protein
MKNLMMFLGAVLLVGAAACSSSSNGATKAASGACPAVGDTTNCSADPPATQSDVDTCNKLEGDATCGSKYTAYYECAGQNDKCTASNTTDESAIQAACATQYSAYTSCVAGESTVDGG